MSMNEALPWSHFAVGLAGGALAFVHCSGMCGGFALHLARGGAFAQALGRQLFWHVGKTCTYVFLGALAGFGGSRLDVLLGVSWAARLLAVAAGAAMVLAGLTLLGMVPRRRPAAGSSPGWWATLYGGLFEHPAPVAALGLGVATGFLPCPIVLAFLAYAARSASVPAGMATLAGLGVGTMWALLLVGLTGHALGHRLRRPGAVAGGVVLVALGLVTALRGTEVLHRVMGCPAQSAHADAACCGDVGKVNSPAVER